MPPLTPEQIALRSTFIGGSDAAAVCGVNPYRTAYDVFLDKIGKGKPIVETEAMRWGAIHEDQIRGEFGRISGRTTVLDHLTYRHPVAGFIGCHVDSFQLDNRTGRKGVTEIKSTRKRLAKGECPEHYVVQLYHNLMCTQLEWGTVVILIQGSEMVWYDFLLTPQIAASIMTLETRFWKAVEAKNWSIFGIE